MNRTLTPSYRVKVAEEQLVNLPAVQLITLDTVAVKQAFRDLGKFHLCSRCDGSGMTYWGRCFKCYGLGTTKDMQVTPEALLAQLTADPKPLAKQVAKVQAKALREQQKREAAKAAAAAAFAQRQVDTLAHLTDERRADFNQAVAQTYQPGGREDFQWSIQQQWLRHGKLSPVQVDKFLAAYDRVVARAKRAEETFAPDVGGVVVATAKVGNVTEGFGDGRFRGAYKKFVLNGSDGLKYVVKTSAQQLSEDLSQAKEAGLEVLVEGEVRWVSPDKQVVVLNPRRVKVK